MGADVGLRVQSAISTTEGVSVEVVDGKVVLRAANGFSGPATVTYRVADDDGKITEVTTTVQVRGVALAPDPSPAPSPAADGSDLAHTGGDLRVVAWGLTLMVLGLAFLGYSSGRRKRLHGRG